jgi:hypothetical protein
MHWGRQSVCSSPSPGILSRLVLVPVVPAAPGSQWASAQSVRSHGVRRRFGPPATAMSVASADNLRTVNEHSEGVAELRPAAFLEVSESSRQSPTASDQSVDAP